MLPLFFNQVAAQQPPATQPHGAMPVQHPGGITPVYILHLVPKSEGKVYTLYHRSRVTLTLNDGKEITGKVLAVSNTSLALETVTIPLADIREIAYKPGSALGVIAALATTAGLVAVAITIDADRSPTEDAVFYGGIGLAVAGGAVLIPTYFSKKHFSSSDYDFVPVDINSPDGK